MRQAEEIFASISDARPDPAMISIAQKIIEQQEGPFDPSLFVDRYRVLIPAMPSRHTDLMTPGSRALLAGDYASSGRVLGQALFGCFPLPLRKLSPVSSMRWALWMRRSRMASA